MTGRMQDKPEKAVPEPPKQQLRIVSYQGEWVCECGRKGKLWDNPCSCGLAGPCRDWVRGRCSYGDQCRYISWVPDLDVLPDTRCADWGLRLVRIYVHREA